MSTIAETLSASRPNRLGSAVAAFVRRAATRRRSRSLVNDLRGMDDHILADIGLSRESVDGAAFTSDPMAHLKTVRGWSQ